MVIDERQMKNYQKVDFLIVLDKILLEELMMKSKFLKAALIVVLCLFEVILQGGAALAAGGSIDSYEPWGCNAGTFLLALVPIGIIYATKIRKK